MDLHAKTAQLYTRGCVEPKQYSYSDFDRNQLFLDQTEHFLESVETRSRPIVDLVDGLQSLRMALAVKQSLATRRAVEFATSPTNPGALRV